MFKLITYKVDMSEILVSIVYLGWTYQIKIDLGIGLKIEFHFIYFLEFSVVNSKSGVDGDCGMPTHYNHK